MKLYLFSILFVLIALKDSSAQTSPADLPDFQQDIAALESQLTDSLGFEKIIQRIKSTRNDPRLSLRYVAFFESMHARYPDIPKDLITIKRLKSNRYNELAWNNQRINAELAFRQLDTSDRLAREIDFVTGLMRNEYGRGVIYRFKGENDKALQHFYKYLEHYSDPFDSASVANVQFQIGVSLLDMGRLEESIRALSECAAIDEALDRPNYAYNSLGIAYRKAGLFDKSEAAYRKAYQHWKERDYTEGQSRALMNLGNLKLETGDRDAAKKLFLRSVALDQGNDYALAYSTENLGNWYLEAQQYDSAFYYSNQSYQLRKKLDNKRELMMAEYQLAKIHMARNQHSRALPLLQGAYQTAKDLVEQEKIRDIAADLSRWHKEQGEYRAALQYKNEFIAAKDSMLNESIARAVADVAEKYETEQKERTIEQLNKENQLQANLLQLRQRQLLIVSIGSILLAGLLFGIFSLYRKVRSQNEIIQKNLREKETLLKEIHHRVKNNLQVIASLLRIQSRNISDTKAKEAIRESRSRVRSMALIHEDLYREDDLSGVSMDVYLTKLSRDIFNVYNIAAHRIRLDTDIAPIRLDVETVIPIGLIVNELITNALKHAFPGEMSGTVSLSLQEHKNRLILSVKDDGQGVQGEADVNSFGLSMIETFQDKLGGDIDLESKDGTCIRMTIKNYRKLEAAYAAA